MAHTKAIGTSKNGRDSQAKYRGVKLHDGQEAQAGSVIVRQTGSSFWPGQGVRQGSDYTLYAITSGHVRFATKKKTAHTGRRKVVKIVNVIAA